MMGKLACSSAMILNVMNGIRVVISPKYEGCTQSCCYFLSLLPLHARGNIVQNPIGGALSIRDGLEHQAQQRLSCLHHRFSWAEVYRQKNEQLLHNMSYDTTGIEYCSISNFKFTAGETKDIKVAYRSFNPTSPKTVLIPTCYCGRINTTLNFTAGALKDYNVIVVAMLGNGESSSPSNDNDFPKEYSLRYQVG